MRADHHRLLKILAAAAALPILATATPAAAAPTAPTASTTQDDLENVIEQYNKVAAEIDDDQAKVTDLTHTIKTLDKRLIAAQGRLLPAIRHYYETDSVTGALVALDGGGLAALTDQQGMATALAHHTHAQVTALVKARNKAAAARRSLNATLATLTKRETDLAARKTVILARLAAQAAVDKRLPPVDTQDPDPLRPVPCPYSTPVTVASTIAVETACAQIGKPYLWAAAGPNKFDCSGLAVYAWGKAGVHLRHFTGFMWVDLPSIREDQLRPGDLVFFFPPRMHHVGIYIGGGWMVVAPHTGDVVREQHVFGGMPIGGYRRP